MNVHRAACTHLHYEPGGGGVWEDTWYTHVHVQLQPEPHWMLYIHTMSYIHDYKLLQDKMSVSITDVPLNGFVPHTVPFNMVLLEL